MPLRVSVIDRYILFSIRQRKICPKQRFNEKATLQSKGTELWLEVYLSVLSVMERDGRRCSTVQQNDHCWKLKSSSCYFHSFFMFLVTR